MLRIVDDNDALAEGVTVAGRYTLERVVGEGGMGVVWAARHVLTHKACALKFLKERRAKDPKSYERLLREARAACAVRHPNVAQVHDLLELPSGAPFIVMDLLEGEPLSRRLERGPMSARETLELLAPTMDAVLAAHAHGIVHRDLKPDNVFLEQSDGREISVKVLDFGIAKLAEGMIEDAPPEAVTTDLSRSVTSTYSVLGTPKYMAPEQGQALGNVGFPSDVWALGMIAFECATGGLPLASGDAKRDDAMATALEEHAITGDFAALITQMVSEDPKARPGLADARARVEKVLRGEVAKPVVVRRRRDVIAVAMVGVVAMAVGAWVFVRPGGDRVGVGAGASSQVGMESATASVIPTTTTTTTTTIATAPATTAAIATAPASATATAVRTSATAVRVAPSPSASSSNGIPTHVRD